VHPGERQHGFTGVLVDQAIQYAVDRGAERVLAFPPPEDRARMMAPEEKYSGTLGLYLEKGFQNMGKLSSSSVLVVKSHFIQKPRLSLKTV
jgi:GNAT superfamily N-acetyltransferase